MAGGNGKGGNNVIILRPSQQRTSLEDLNKLVDETHKQLVEATKEVKFMGSLEEDSRIKWLALQYRAYLERRKLMVYGTSLEYTTPPTFVDYIEIKK